MSENGREMFFFVENFLFKNATFFG